MKKGILTPIQTPGGAVRKTQASCTTRAQTRPNAENPSQIHPSVLELCARLNSRMRRCVHGHTTFLTLQPQRSHQAVSAEGRALGGTPFGHMKWSGPWSW
jgi:surface antigen